MVKHSSGYRVRAVLPRWWPRTTATHSVVAWITDTLDRHRGVRFSSRCGLALAAEAIELTTRTVVRWRKCFRAQAMQGLQ